MAPSNLFFWEVDTQADFMLPTGKLYVPGAERLLPNIRRLTEAARQGRVFLRLPWLLPHQGRSRIQNLSPPLHQRHPRLRLCSRSPDGESCHHPERSRGHLAARSFPIPADSSRKTDAGHLRKPPRRRTRQAIGRRCRIRSLRRGDGILRPFSGQGIARTQATASPWSRMPSKP